MLKSPTTTKKKTHWVHPGRMIELEYMEHYGISIYRLAELLDVPYSRIYRLIRGGCGVDCEMDMRLCTLFGAPEGLFLRWQQGYERRAHAIPAASLEKIKAGHDRLMAMAG